MRKVNMRIIVITILLLFYTHISRAVDTSDYMWFSYIGTNQYAFVASQIDIDLTPVWRETDDQPPLSPRIALKLAKVRLSKLVPDSEHWRLNDIALSPLRLPDDGRWVYLVRFYPPRPPGKSEGFQFDMRIPVLMSGVAIEPRVKPKSDVLENDK